MTLDLSSGLDLSVLSSSPTSGSVLEYLTKLLLRIKCAMRSTEQSLTDAYWVLFYASCGTSLDLSVLICKVGDGIGEY